MSPTIVRDSWGPLGSAALRAGAVTPRCPPTKRGEGVPGKKRKKKKQRISRKTPPA
jgi:hypothetical protein